MVDHVLAIKLSLGHEAWDIRGSGLLSAMKYNEQGVGCGVWGVGTPPLREKFQTRTPYFFALCVSKHI